MEVKKYTKLKLTHNAVSVWTEDPITSTHSTNVEISSIKRYSDHRYRDVLRVGLLPEDLSGKFRGAFIVDKSEVIPIVRTILSIYTEGMAELEKAAVFEEVLH